MTQDNTYNGWHNYATWRIKLELFDDYDISDFYDSWGGVTHKLADYLEHLADEYVFHNVPDGLAKDYAGAFLSEVNWYQIADNLIRDYEWENDANEQNTKEDYDETI